MFLACVIVSVLLALVALGSAGGKLTGAAQPMETLEHVGAAGIVRWLACLEIAGAIGLIVGLFVAPIGIAAASGLVLYFLGAVIAHIRVKDPIGQMMPPAVLMLVAVAALVLRIATV